MAVNSGLLKIENKAITSITSHERCIIEDGCQLSEMIEKIGLYWHFVDLVWVFVFLAFYLM